MRAYTFTNWMMRPIQQGIQPAHCLIDMFPKYKNPNSEQYKILWDWAENHKTMICLNGGNADEMRSIWEQLLRLGVALDLPIQKFNEDRASLDNVMTSCAIIVPEMVYSYAALLRTRDTGAPLTEWFQTHGINVYSLSNEFVDLATLLGKYPLAN